MNSMCGVYTNGRLYTNAVYMREHLLAFLYKSYASTCSPEPYLLFCTWFTVSRMDLDGSDYSIVVDSSSNVGPIAVDYHWR